MNLGEKILRDLVRADGAQSVSAVAVAAFGSADGRAVAQPLRRLEEAGLAQRTRTHYFWMPTARGRAVDAIMDGISAERGGSFAPMLRSGISSEECLALQFGGRAA